MVSFKVNMIPRGRQHPQRQESSGNTAALPLSVSPSRRFKTTHMADHHDASPRKRNRAPIEELHFKKPKLNLPPRSPRTRFPLTRDALRELNRRNKEAARSAPDSMPKRPGSPVPRPPAAADLSACSTSDLERFARHGGPDLSDLKGVSTLPCARSPRLFFLSSLLTL